MNAQKGFTLIELMIVVAIIGILAAIAIPAYQDYIARSQATEAITLAGGLKGAVSETFAQDATCPDNSKAATNGINLATEITGKYVASVTTGGTAAEGGGCTITAKMLGTGVSTGLKDGEIVLTLSNADKGSSVWGCTSTNIDQKYLPKSCTSSKKAG
ncbi:pilin [Acinetobacter sp. B51(2017)]|uniref:pilin n=1 Tax=Acinetobacter sp. B51(2017) TaxID=2060938 RepID=UPI000F0761B8|nr:pilin [Acinetobacter sp. B51(2017)]